MAIKTNIYSRKICYDILHSVLNEGSLAHDFFTSESLWGKLENRDRAFAKLLVMSCIRQHGQLNICINHFLKKSPKPQIRTIIMLGVAQLLILRTEPHAAIHTSVSLARHLTGESYTGLTNGVLRTIARSGEKIFAATSPADNLPVFFRKNWSANWGESSVQEIMQLAQNQPPLDITLKNMSESSKIKWSKKLSAKLISSNSIRLKPVADVTKLAGYQEGEWWVQDCAAALPAKLMRDVRGKHIIDLCAAPGGKTAQLISSGALVIAIDKSRKRIKRLTDNLDRLRLNAKVICSDGRNYKPEFLVDGVLLDAPCSASGTIRRRPDVLIGKTPQQILELQSLQIELCLVASKWIKSGGTLVYATCSLQREEGEEVIKAIISNPKAGLSLDPIDKDEVGIFYPFNKKQTTSEYLRILPNQLVNTNTELLGNDGFFIARFKVK